MQGRLDLNDIGGGDKVQIEQTANELRKLGVEIDISTSLSTDYSPYDLIHIFQLDWVPEPYLYAKKAQKLNKPIVLSPIHHSVKEVAKFDELYAFGFRRLAKYLLNNQFLRDTLKNIYRSIFNFKKIYPTAVSLLLGFKTIQRKTLELSNKVLVQTKLEATDLMETYEVKIDWVKVPNGVGEVYITTTNYVNPLEFNDYILCVGRIEARKNQISVIHAVHKLRQRLNIDLQLVFIGPRNIEHHVEYNLLFDSIVAKNPWVHYLGRVAYEKMPSYFHFAKVGVSASWFETSGLTSLEALYCGSNPVAAGERQKEYLGNFAFYCEPDKIDTIEQAIEKAYFAPRPQLSDELKAQYTWKNAAIKTLEVYKELLNV